MDQRTIGVVLAGGVGRRFGGPKAFHVHGGQTFAERAARSLAGCTAEVLISVAQGMELPALGQRVIFDAAPAGRGPLAGLAAAWEVEPQADLLVLACDYPAIPTELLCELRDRGRRGAADIVTAVEECGRKHPLVAWWSRRMRRPVVAALAADRLRVGRLLEDHEIGTVRPSELRLGDEVLKNVNRAADL